MKDKKDETKVEQAESTDSNLLTKLRSDWIAGGKKTPGAFIESGFLSSRPRNLTPLTEEEQRTMNRLRAEMDAVWTEFKKYRQAVSAALRNRNAAKRRYECIRDRWLPLVERDLDVAALAKLKQKRAAL